MDSIELTAVARQQRGKQVKQLRKDGHVPAVFYGHGTDTQTLSITSKELEHVYASAGGNKIISLKIGDAKAENALIHDVQHDSRSGHIIHADFYKVKMNEKIKTEVPLRFTGESTAVYQQEGTLLTNLETVEIEALPANLPEAIEVDISVLDDFEKTIHVSDLKMPANVELLTDVEELVAKVEAPRSQEELDELEEEVVEELPEGAEEDTEVVTEENEGNKDKEAKPKE